MGSARLLQRGVHKMASGSTRLRFADIGVNLLDPMYQGHYHSKQAHRPDLGHVLSRARAAGVEAQIVTAGSWQEAQEAIKLAQSEQDLFCTVGCHPTRVTEFDAHPDGPDDYLSKLERLAQEHRWESGGSGKGKVVAVGECGLDYDRLQFAPADAQKRCFEKQLELAERVRLPLFLHSRSAHRDLVSLLEPHMEALIKAIGPSGVGVVHSFDGTTDEMQELVRMGLYIGINGCSLKTEQNLVTVAQIPLDRLLLETDAPWCEPRPSHTSSASLDAFKKQQQAASAVFFPAQVKKEKWSEANPTAVKGRNEPCAIGQIAAVVAAAQKRKIEEVAQAARENTRRLFSI